MKQIHLIFARAANGVIGLRGGLPWHLPEDLLHFKRTTQGHPVIMGRKTWDSLPARFRPLPGRQNIVLTRQPHWQAPGALRADSLEHALDLCPQGSQAWVIGGADIYQQALPLATTVVVTEIDAVFEGDAYAPHLGPQWVPVSSAEHIAGSGLKFKFVCYQNTLQSGAYV